MVADDLEEIRSAAERVAEVALATRELVSRPGSVLGARYVELYEMDSAAGGGCTFREAKIKGYAAFQAQWLNRRGLNASQCAIIGVRGESMEPTLPDGCSIMVARDRRRRSNGHIFVIATDGGLIVKRAGRDQTGRWQLVSNHPSWNSLPWPNDAPIEGEVVWMGRSFI